MKTGAWPKPDASPTAASWSLPANLGGALPARNPSGGIRVCEAEEILASATAWWDANKYTPGDRWLRNKGTGGDVLDARLGSSLIPNTNDPLYLAPEDRGYVYLPTGMYNAMMVPDATNLRLSNDLDIRARISADTWSQNYAVLVSKWSTIGEQRGWMFFLDPSGKLSFQWSPDGTVSNNVSNYSTSPTSVLQWAPTWARVTVDIDNGASGSTTTFYTSNDGVSWTQVGNPIVKGLATIFACSANVEIGSQTTMSASMLNAKVYQAQVRNGIDGTTVLDIDCDAITSGGQSGFLARTGQLVTINRATSGRKTVAMPNRERKKSDDACVYLPGSVSGSGSLRVPDEASFEFAGDLDLRVQVALDSYATGTSQCVMTRAYNNKAWSFAVGTTGALILRWTTLGATDMYASSTANVPVPAGMKVWLRVTLDVDNGAGGNTVTFYYSLDGNTWVQLGTPVVQAGVTSINTVTNTHLFCGGMGDAWYNPGPGRYYRFQIRNGIDGTLVFDLDTSAANKNWIAGQAATMLALTGQTATLYGTLTNGGMRVLPEKWEAGRPVFLFGTDDYMEVQGAAQHAMLNFTQADSLTVLVIGRRFGTGTLGYLCKKTDFSVSPGWAVFSYLANTYISFNMGDGLHNPSPSTLTNLREGQAFTYAAGRDAAARRLNGYLSGGLTPYSTFYDIYSCAPYANALPVRIGSGSAGGNIGDWEFIAAAIFRRTLTPREIDLLARYYGTVW